jgi:hypothetical protein
MPEIKPELISIREQLKSAIFKYMDENVMATLDPIDMSRIIDDSAFKDFSLNITLEARNSESDYWIQCEGWINSPKNELKKGFTVVLDYDVKPKDSYSKEDVDEFIDILLDNYAILKEIQSKFSTK